MKLQFWPLLRDTWTIYRAHWKVLVPLTVVVLIPQAIGDALLGDLEIERLDNPSDLLKLASIPVTVAVNLGGEALLAGIVAALVMEWRRRVEHQSLRTAARRIPFGRLIAIDLMLALGTALGIILLVVPGVLVFTYLLIAPTLIELEHLSIRESVRRSIELVRGSFWRVLGFALLVAVASDAIAAALESPFHGTSGEAAFQLGIEGVIKPVTTVATVILALALIDLDAKRAAREPIP